MYKLTLTKNAEDDIARLKKSGDKPLLIKIDKILNEIILHPYTGTGKPE